MIILGDLTQTITTSNLERPLSSKSVGRGCGRGKVKPGNFSSLLNPGELKKHADDTGKYYWFLFDINKNA